LAIAAGGAHIFATLNVPDGARAIVVFAHGSGSSRHSPRNRLVAADLVRYGFGAMLTDLLSAEEDAIDRSTAEFRFNIALLAERLSAATRTLLERRDTARLPIGYFGASTGAAAALVAAARAPDVVRAIVSRGGRPDLAGDALPHVRAPSLFIVGSADAIVLKLNEDAIRRIPATTELSIVAGATHLFEEPGALDEVTRLSRAWFERYLVA
jgi:pimeloyl-ACP methyl ester carboxylesterase